MGNDVTWWKDRDTWMPDLAHDAPPALEPEEGQHGSDEDADDSNSNGADEFHDVEPPDRDSE